MSGRAQDTAPAPAGRPVRLVSTPPGFWTLVLGTSLAVLAPMFGFLAGTMTGSPDPSAAMTPLYWGLLLGFLLGGLGTIVAVLGLWRLWTHHRRGDAARRDEADGEAP